MKVVKKRSITVTCEGPGPAVGRAPSVCKEGTVLRCSVTGGRREGRGQDVRSSPLLDSGGGALDARGPADNSCCFVTGALVCFCLCLFVFVCLPHNVSDKLLQIQQLLLSLTLDSSQVRERRSSSHLSHTSCSSHFLFLPPLLENTFDR